jgi:GAF domain-containing protein
LREGDGFRAAAMHNAPPAYAEQRAGVIHPNRNSTLWQAVQTKQPAQIADMTKLQAYVEGDSWYISAVSLGGHRGVLSVPMLHENELIGVIAIFRQEAGAFADKQIELLTNFAKQAVIAIENRRLLNELRQSLEQQIATADVLRVISSSPGELKPVFHSMLEKATQLCEASFGTLFLREGESFRRVALHNAPTKYAEYTDKNPLIPHHQSRSLNRLIDTKQAVPVTDMMVEEPETPVTKFGKARSLVTVPMLKDNELVGAIGIFRQEVRPFTDKQIELVQNFAAQAVIAIENARLLNELREYLQQQTATSEILDVISNSPTDSQPAFEAIVRSGLKLFPDAAIMIALPEGGVVKGAAIAAADPAGAAALRARLPLPLSREFISSAAILDQREIDLADAREAPPELSAGARDFLASGYRAITVMPMMRGDTAVGAVNVMRRHPVQLSEKQRELLRTFANQAVIAIENTRLFSELRQRTDDLTESLEQQTATADVLRVISNSPTNVQPVFDSIAESAVRLCCGQFSFVIRFDGKVMNFASCFGLNAEGLDVFRSLFPRTASDDTVSGRAILQRAIVEISDVEADAAYGMQSQRLARTVNYRSIVGVPLLHEGNPIGAFAVARANPGSFPERQIALLQAFADQAVIAIRNVRLFDEVQARTEELTESLDQQTATAEVLKVISRSAFDLQPVFDAMAENAVKLCEAERAFIFRFDGKQLRAVATYNVGPEVRQFVDQNPIIPGRHSVSARAALERRTVQVPDVQADPEYAYAARDSELIRTVLAVPMLKGDDLVGTITIYRLEANPFTDKQIALVETFAAQAVIAIENTRLLNELRGSLQQQTATADVLKAISRSTFDLNTVLQTLVEAAARLCDADQGTIAREQEGVFVRAATYGFSAEFTDYVTHVPVERERGSATGRALLEGRTVHIPDVQSDPDYTFNKAKELGGFRTILAVPMLRDGVAIGVLALTRVDVRPFTEKQIDLVTTFADQAAIAIENVRLFESAEVRTRELAESLEELRTAQDRLVQTQKLASLGQLTAGIAHEIKNPLNFVNNFSGVSAELVDELKQALERVTTDRETQAELTELIDTLYGNLEKIVQHGKRADSIVKNMLLHSREGSGEHRPVDINVVLEESLNLAYHGARAERQGFNITLERSFDPAAGEVDLFPQEITRVFLNLISNGFYAANKRKLASGHESYEPTLMAATKNLGDRVEIRIRDNGIGIPPDVKERMFNPFFTTKPAGEGTGLGLSISHDIVVKQHAGVIEVESEPGEFTEFRIVLPRRAAFIAKNGGRA